MSITEQNKAQIERLRSAISESFTKCNNKNAIMPTQQVIENLAACIESIPKGITPTGNINITDNGEYDVTEFAKAIVNVASGITPIPDGYINSSETLSYVTQSATGTYTGAGETLSNISIAVGFKPKIFFLRNIDAIYSKSSNSPYTMLGATMIRDNEYEELAHSINFILLGDYSNGYARGGYTTGNYFYSTETGVAGSGSNVIAASGKNYQWYAWG